MLLNQLEEYFRVFGDKNRNGILQIELGCHMMNCLKPRVIHGFVNGLSDAIYQKRKHTRPNDDQESDWFKAERLFYNKFVGEGVMMLCIKCILLAAYCDCIEAGLNLPSIDGAIQNLAINDGKIIECLERLSPVQCGILFYVACEVSLDDQKVEFFLRREIAELYLENECEIIGSPSSPC